jgi:hypothetical protein
MKAEFKFGGPGRRTTRHLPQLLTVVFNSAIAVRYCLAAQRNEKHGFPRTAAMEWRRAAELLTLIPLAANRCWREWERITRLPRRLAGPIVSAAAPNRLPTSDTEVIAAALPVLPSAPLAVAT